MVILLNGSFGIGKTTVARLVSNRLPGTALFDPELIGFVLQHARRLARRPVDDFQDLRSWRRSFVLGVQAIRKIRGNVIVPMAFSNPSYLAEVRSGIEQFEPQVLHYCLVAPLEVVRERLRQRGSGASERDVAWQYRRATECRAAHIEDGFAEQVPVSGLTADEVADEIVARIETRNGADFDPGKLAP